MVDLESVARKAGTSIGATTRLALRVLPSVRRNSLEHFIRYETANPYIANMLYSIARIDEQFKGSAAITVDEAIEMLRRDKLAGAIQLLRYINFMIYSGGGGLRGLYYIGENYIFAQHGIVAKRNAGSSIGAAAASEYGLRAQDNTYGIDVSPQRFEQVALELARTLGTTHNFEFMPEFVAKALKKGFVQMDQIRIGVRGTIFESIFSQAPLVRVLSQEFGPLRLEDVTGLDIMVSDMAKGQRVVLSSENEYRSTPVAEAIAESTTFPMVYGLRRNFGIHADGGLHVAPLRMIFESGADLVYATLLNTVLPEIKDIKGKWAIGKMRIYGRVYDIMQRDATQETILHLTGKPLEHVAAEFDPYGRILLSAKDLSRWDSFMLSDEHYELPDLGKPGTTSTIEKLDPTRRYGKYNPELFTQNPTMHNRFYGRHTTIPHR